MLFNETEVISREHIEYKFSNLVLHNHDYVIKTRLILLVVCNKNSISKQNIFVYFYLILTQKTMFYNA